jgi:hypothetical protein
MSPVLLVLKIILAIIRRMNDPIKGEGFGRMDTERQGEHH